MVAPPTLPLGELTLLRKRIRTLMRFLVLDLQEFVQLFVLRLQPLLLGHQGFDLSPKLVYTIRPPDRIRKPSKPFTNNVEEHRQSTSDRPLRRDWNGKLIRYFGNEITDLPVYKHVFSAHIFCAGF